MKNKICPICKKIFEPKHPRQKYCSVFCLRVARSKNFYSWLSKNKERYAELQKKYISNRRLREK